MAEKIRFGIIGFGHIGKRHAAVIANNPAAELYMVCDEKPKENFKDEDLYGAKFTSSAERLLNSDVDVVIVATPNGLHSEQAMNALEANKHVVIEKPMGLSSDACKEIIEYSKEQKKAVFCVMQNRFSPAAIFLNTLVKEDKLGKIYSIHVNCFWNRDERYYNSEAWRGSKDLDGGVLYTQFSHFIDLIYWLFGDLKVKHSSLYNFNHQKLTQFEDSGTVIFQLKDEPETKGVFNFTTSVFNENLESSITIIAENGTVKVGGQYMNKLEYCKVKDYDTPTLPETAPPNDYGTYKGSAANHFYIIQNVIDVLNGKEEIATSGFEGMKVVRIIEKMYKPKESEL